MTAPRDQPTGRCEGGEGQDRPHTVAVVGGGVSGLATTWFLASRSRACVTLLEAGARLGGKVRTELLAGMPVEAGPDGFLPEPAAIQLCEDLGLGSELVSALTSQAYLWTEGGLRPLQVADSPRGATPERLTTLRGGLEGMVKALAGRLAGLDIRFHTEVSGVERTPAGSFLLHMRSGRAIPASAVVLAVPAWAAGAVLPGLMPDVAATLAGIRYLDMGVVNLVYAGRPWRLPGSGFLADERAGRLISGCTWLSAKWPHLASDEVTLIRVTVGGRGGQGWKSMDDAELVGAAHEELTRALGPGPPPEEAHVVRWERAVADPRSLDREVVRRAQKVACGEGVLLAAGGYLGGGVASCIADASLAAEEAARWAR